MEALRAAVRAKEDASRPQPPSSETSTIGEIPVMHFQGPVEPFTLSVKQLEIVRACWSAVQGFLWVNAGRENPAPVHPEPAYKAGRPPRTKETKGWAGERAATLGVSPVPNGNASANADREEAFEEADASPEEETAPCLEPSVTAYEENHGEHLPIRERPNYGVSRIDQPEKANHGWYVRITKNGHTEQKFFADKSYGGRGTALQNAREYRDYLKDQILGIPRSNPPVTGWEPAYASTIGGSNPYDAATPVRFEQPMADEDEDDFKI